MKYAILYDENHYIENLGFDPDRAAVYRVRIWDSPSPLSVVVEVLPGSRLGILECREDHYRVCTKDGQEGWIGKLQVEKIEDK